MNWRAAFIRELVNQLDDEELDRCGWSVTTDDPRGLRVFIQDFGGKGRAHASCVIYIAHEDWTMAPDRSALCQFKIAQMLTHLRQRAATFPPTARSR